MDAAAELGRNTVSRHHIQLEQTDAGRPNPSRETKFSGANADKEIFFFPVQLTTSKIDNLTRLIHTLAICVTIHAYIHSRTCFFFSFFFLDLSLFPSTFCTISAFSLYGEYVIRSFLPNGVFLPCDHGLDFLFLTPAYLRFQSINHIHTYIEGGLGLTSSSSIKGAAYIGCHALVLGRVVAASARGNLPSLLERLPERPMASALIEELKIVSTEAKRSQIEDAVGSSWAALAAEEGPQGRGIGTLLVEAGAGGGGGGRGGEGEDRGGEGGARGRGCWTARTMGGSVVHPA